MWFQYREHLLEKGLDVFIRDDIGLQVVKKY